MLPRALSGVSAAWPTVSDQSMWRMYSSNVDQTLLAGLGVWVTPA
jgi:hypothetical protein